MRKFKSAKLVRDKIVEGIIESGNKDRYFSKGSFKKRLYVDTVETRENSKWTDYYLADPDKYPEIKD